MSIEEVNPARRVRGPRRHVSVRGLLACVAVVGALLGTGQLWWRSEHFRKQAAICSYFELQFRRNAADAAGDDTLEPRWTAEEEREYAWWNRIESYKYGALNLAYRRIARRPWEALPPGMADSVVGFDLAAFSASEIEEMVAKWEEEDQAAPCQRAVSSSADASDASAAAP